MVESPMLATCNVASDTFFDITSVACATSPIESPRGAKDI
jgi:hypothetical protein